MTIDHPDQVLASDITYIRMRQGIHLPGSHHYVLSRDISITLDAGFCMETFQGVQLASGRKSYSNQHGRAFDKTYLSSVFGAASNTRKFIFTNMRLFPRPDITWRNASGFTTRNDSANLWVIGRLMKFISKMRRKQKMLQLVKESSNGQR